ncbi:MAG: hypothetical protein ACYDAY_02230 [Candidatus Dormibacteria bacterium]
MLLAVGVWLPTAAASTILAGGMYAETQQVLRQGADDPQVQMATDLAARFAAGAPVPVVAPGDRVDLATSLATFTMVFDDGGRLVSSSASLDGSNPPLPQGVLDHTRTDIQDRVSWQPRDGVRVALVVERYAGPAGAGFVAVGRSLRLVEQRENDALVVALAVWLGALAVAAVASLASAWALRALGSRM